MCGMGVLFDYFAADSDDVAASVIDRLGGPGSSARPTAPAITPRRRLFRRSTEQAPALRDETTELVFDTVCDTGIDPVVQLGTLEELLTGRPFDDILDDDRSGKAVATHNDGEELVLTLTESVTTALVEASAKRLSEVAVPWSQTEEFWGTADPEVLSDFLGELRGLARRARARDQQLYCWVCV